MDLVIANVRLVGGRTDPVDIGIDDGRITAVAAPGTLRGADVLDGARLHAFPGLCDLHCHLRDPGFTHKEDLSSGARSAAAGGFTDICCMPNTSPPLDTPAAVRDILDRADPAWARVHPVGAISQKMQGRRLTDFAAMRGAGAVAFSDDGVPVEDADLMAEALEEAAREEVLLMVHEEDRNLTGRGAANAGKHAEQAGLPGIPAASEEVLVARDLYLAAGHGGRLHFCHISTAGSLELIRRFKARYPGRVTCETAPHYFSATDELVLSRDSNAKMNPPLRTEADRQAVIRALADGTIDAIATDHAPHADSEKKKPFEKAPFGIIGFETALALAITHLYAPGHLSLERIAELLSTAPRRIAGLPGGALAPGEPADIALVDTGERWRYEEKDVVSRARNSPFLGSPLQGRVKVTVLGGRVVWPDRHPNERNRRGSAG